MKVDYKVGDRVQITENPYTFCSGEWVTITDVFFLGNDSRQYIVAENDHGTEVGGYVNMIKGEEGNYE